MPKETVTVPLSAEAFEIAASVMALLIHPSDRGRREQLYLGFCHLTLREQAHDADWHSSQQLIQPRYLMFEEAKAKLLCRRGMKIYHRERLIAAEIAFPFIASAVVGEL